MVGSPEAALRCVVDHYDDHVSLQQLNIEARTTDRASWKNCLAHPFDDPGHRQAAMV